MPTYGVERLNPKLKLAEWNLALPPKTMKWPTRGQRRASINSFGFGGANAHAILDDAYHYLNERGLVGNHSTTVHEDDDGSDSGVSTGSGTPELTEDQDAASLFVFSTKDQAGIQRLAASYAETLQRTGLGKAGRHYLSNLAYTLSERRSHFDFRASFVASTLVELSTQLSKGLSKAKRSSRQDNNLVFVFTGQGAQWPAMGQQLLSSAVFYNSMRTSQDYLQELGCEWDALEELKKSVGSKIDFPQYSQTLCTMLQIALVDLLRYWKVTPKASVGHSSGEIGKSTSSLDPVLSLAAYLLTLPSRCLLCILHHPSRRCQGGLCPRSQLRHRHPQGRYAGHGPLANRGRGIPRPSSSGLCCYRLHQQPFKRDHLGRR